MATNDFPSGATPYRGDGWTEDGGIETTGWNFKMDWSGTTGGTVKRIMKRGAGREYADDVIGEPHPDADWLICEKATVDSTGPTDTVTETYKGVPENVDIVKYKASVNLTQEPIDTHRKFEEFAGRPSDMVDGVVPDKGTIFDDERDLVGVFTKFAAFIESSEDDVDGTEKNGKYGISQYLEPSITWEEEKVLGSSSFDSADQSDLAGIADVGTRTKDVPRKIFELGQSANAAGGTDLTDLTKNGDGYDRDWLLVSATWESVGNGAKLVRKWRLSGRNGWNQSIYRLEEAE